MDAQLYEQLAREDKLYLLRTLNTNPMRRAGTIIASAAPMPSARTRAALRALKAAEQPSRSLPMPAPKRSF